VEVVTSLSQGRTAAAQCGLFKHKSVLVIFEPPCNILSPPPLSLSLSLKATITVHTLMLCDVRPNVSYVPSFDFTGN